MVVTWWVSLGGLWGMGQICACSAEGALLSLRSPHLVRSVGVVPRLCVYLITSYTR